MEATRETGGDLDWGDRGGSRLGRQGRVGRLER